MLRPFWSKIFAFNWPFGIFLILLLGIPRFILVLQANVTANYNLIPFIFLFMMLSPVLFLNREGRRSIGIKRPTNWIWLLYSILIGVVFCSITYSVAELLYQDEISNWFVYISRSYAVSSSGITDDDRLIYFIIYSVIGMSFSPVGEELFYRGLVQRSFVQRFGSSRASTIDSLAFALTHIAHFGIVYTAIGWKFLPVPALLWVTFMFAASKLFFLCKEKSGSILGAILAHASFNVMMMYFIFYHVLG